MKLLALLVAVTFTASCVSPKIVPTNVAKPPAEPEWVPVTDIVQAGLFPTGTYCGTSERGSDVYVDATVECPEMKYVDVQQNLVHRSFRAGVRPGNWTNVAIFFTMKKIQCGEISAMGCTLGFTDGTVISVVSLYFPWRKMILKHELTHAAYLLRKESDMKHFCLDNPDSIVCD